MAFDNVRLPENVEQGAEGGPAFQTSVLSLGTGSEQRNVDWSAQRLQWDISYGLDHKNDYSLVVDFFYARQGRARAFRFKDWTDYEASDTPIGTGDGVDTTFQLRKAYTSGSVTYYRKITRPVSGTTVIRVNGVVTSASVNVNTGIVTISPAPADGAAITATFEFDVPVRFDVDKLPLIARTATVASISSIPVIEIIE